MNPENPQEQPNTTPQDSPQPSQPAFQPQQPSVTSPEQPQVVAFTQPPQPQTPADPTPMNTSTQFSTAASPGTPTDPSDKNKSLKLWVIVGVGIFVVIVAILSILALTVWSKPTKQDFEAANVTTKEAHTSYHDMQDAYGSYMNKLSEAYKTSGVTPQEVEKSVSSERQEFINASSKHTSLVNKLGEMKALRDQELKDVYEKYREHDSAYVTYLDRLLKAHTQYMKAIKYSCADIFTASKGHDNAETIKDYLKAYADKNRELSKDCLSDLNTVVNSPEKLYATYAKAYVEYVEGRQKVIDTAYAENITDSGYLKREFAKLLPPYSRATDTYVESRTKATKERSNETISEKYYKLIEQKASTAS